LLRFRRQVPFAIAVVRTAASVLRASPRMLVLSLANAVLAVGWTTTVGCTLWLASSGIKDGDPSAAQAAMAVALLVLLLWGLCFFRALCFVAFSGAYARWYFRVELERPLLASVRAAWKSAGSACLGGLVIGAIRTVELVARGCRLSTGPVLGFVSCLLAFLLRCLGEVADYPSEWAYIQCAVRGTSYLDSVHIMLRLATSANLHLISCGLLLDASCTVLTLFGGLVGACSALAAHATVLSAHVAVGGFIFGSLVASAGVQAVAAGAKTVLTAWAADPEPLLLALPEVHMELTQGLLAAWGPAVEEAAARPSTQAVS